jgi:hypothetical protein
MAVFIPNKILCFGSGFNQVSGSRSGNRIRIQNDKMTPKNKEKCKEILCF